MHKDLGMGRAGVRGIQGAPPGEDGAGGDRGRVVTWSTRFRGIPCVVDAEGCDLWTAASADAVVGALMVASLMIATL